MIPDYPFKHRGYNELTPLLPSNHFFVNIPAEKDTVTHYVDAPADSFQMLESLQFASACHFYNRNPI
jgi:hypothetical protein